MWIRIRITDPQSCSRRIQFGSLSGSTTLVLITDQCFGFIESGSGQTSDSGSKLILNTARNWYKIISYSEDFPVKRSPLKDVPVLFLKLKLFCCDLTFFFFKSLDPDSESGSRRTLNPDPKHCHWLYYALLQVMGRAKAELLAKKQMMPDNHPPSTSMRRFWL